MDSRPVLPLKSISFGLRCNKLFIVSLEWSMECCHPSQDFLLLGAATERERAAVGCSYICGTIEEKPLICCQVIVAIFIGII